MGGAEYACASQRALIPVLVIGDEEVGRRALAEALGAVPGHVLDHEEGTVGDEDHVESAVGDDGAV